jgi:hypothetical protein
LSIKPKVIRVSKVLTCKGRVIRVSLNGGIGNQLFQFANGINLALENNCQLQFVESSKKWPNKLQFLGIYPHATYNPEDRDGSLDLPIVRHRKFCVFEQFVENAFSYESIAISNSHTRIQGYFQSEKYFIMNKSIIRNYILQKIKEYKAAQSWDYIIQIRLGDMARDPQVREIHGIVTDEYLDSAIKMHGLSPEKYVVITDDSERIAKELPKFAAIVTHYSHSNSDLEDLCSLTLAKKIIISNSTFGWWGAWLSEGEVVAPKKWFSDLGLQMRNTKDLFPENWTLR